MWVVDHHRRGYKIEVKVDLIGNNKESGKCSGRGVGGGCWAAGRHSGRCALA